MVITIGVGELFAAAARSNSVGGCSDSISMGGGVGGGHHRILAKGERDCWGWGGSSSFVNNVSTAVADCYGPTSPCAFCLRVVTCERHQKLRVVSRRKRVKHF